MGSKTGYRTAYKAWIELQPKENQVESNDRKHPHITNWKEIFGVARTKQKKAAYDRKRQIRQRCRHCGAIKSKW